MGLIAQNDRVRRYPARRRDKKTLQFHGFSNCELKLNIYDFYILFGKTKSVHWHFFA